MAYLVVLLFYLASAIADETCDSCVRVDANCYNVQHLLNLQVNFRTEVVIRKMVVLDSENTLFFSYEPEIDDPEYFKVGYVNLDDPTKSGVLTHDNNTILNFGTLDIDQDKSIVYLGGSDGIYTYGPSKKVIGYSSIGDEILILYFKDNLYIVKANENTIIVKKGDAFESVLDFLDYTIIKKFIVTKDNMIVFLSSYGLFLSKKEKTIWLSKKLSKNAFFRDLTVDLDGVVYALWIDGIYKVIIEKDLAKSSIVRVAAMEDVGAITFDNKNNLLFTSGAAVNKLTLSNATFC
ncbi:unnamed protein product [Diatraea saccharalis]|uniref:Ommochrome-binding protein-like n=1 Tax=Diatraea saccharalis TaxID=40085 RepID=A0A9N9QT01_9NEOP|nr:unnamed protein product [Diatraea saccharalis]